uniref:MABP domain-containing protein n=1 Tax=Anopheles dirus TaxID=7168 RepID=A0A182NVL0_9DIPT
MLKSSTQQQKNILNTVIGALTDNRPITSLQLVEEFEKCPKNFQSINKTYDQDQDADLWREKILIGKRTTRYLCQSKSEGLPGYIVETLKVINEKEISPDGFSQLTRTADTEQKAWRKKQLVYRLAKKGSAKQATTQESQENEYVQLLPTYQLSPKRAAPKPPMYSTGTLNIHTDVEGVPFLLNPALKQYAMNVPPIYEAGVHNEYDFHLERQVLCTTKSQNAQATNPFFH